MVTQEEIERLFKEQQFTIDNTGIYTYTGIYPLFRRDVPAIPELGILAVHNERSQQIIIRILYSQNGNSRSIGKVGSVFLDKYSLELCPDWRKLFLINMYQAFYRVLTFKRCPEGHPMIVRRRKFGTEFLGCSLFPDCAYTEGWGGTFNMEHILEHLL